MKILSYKILTFLYYFLGLGKSQLGISYNKSVMREAIFSQGETICLLCRQTPKQPNPVEDVQDPIEILGSVLFSGTVIRGENCLKLKLL